MAFFIKGKAVFNIRPKSQPRDLPDCIILDNWVFESITAVDDLLAKALQRFATCLLPNNNSCAKLIFSSELPIVFDDNLKTTSVLFSIVD